MKYYLDSNNYIIGWCLTEEPSNSNEQPWPEMNPVGALYDEYKNPKYKLIDKKIVKELQEPTEEQINNRKKLLYEKKVSVEFGKAELAFILLTATKAISEGKEIPQECLDTLNRLEQIKQEIEAEINKT